MSSYSSLSALQTVNEASILLAHPDLVSQSSALTSIAMLEQLLTSSYSVSLMESVFALHGNIPLHADVLASELSLAN